MQRTSARRPFNSFWLQPISGLDSFTQFSELGVFLGRSIKMGRSEQLSGEASQEFAPRFNCEYQKFSSRHI